jgi:hypothetical protein
VNLCWVLARIATDHFTTTRSELLAADWLATVSQKRFEAHSRTVVQVRADVPGQPTTTVVSSMSGHRPLRRRLCCRSKARLSCR